MKAVVFAYNNIGCVGIEALLRAGVGIAGVFTHADDPDEIVYFRSVAETAASHGIPVFAPADVNGPQTVARIRALKPDMIFSFYYRKLLSPEILALAPRGAFNLHGSLLPRYRGKCPVNWVLVNGESETGVTLHKMTPRPDDGDIVAQRRVAMDADDTAATLHAKCAAAAAELMDDVLPHLLDGSATFTPQDASRASCFHGRRPEDGRIDWTAGAACVRNLVRAVTRPYPGAFTFLDGRKVFVWQATVVETVRPAAASSVLSTVPLVVACGHGALRIDLAQAEGGVCISGTQLAEELGLRVGVRFSAAASEARRSEKTKVLILGVNGFIGSHLSRRLLADGAYEVFGMDLASHHVDDLRQFPDFHFCKGDVEIDHGWIEHHVKECDVVLPLVAIATPIEYTRNPIRVFELDFESNLNVIKLCRRYGRRIVFPSTSEVYAMCEDEAFDEDDSRLVLGPIRNQRWIYSSVKQLLDRVIWAYGTKGLRFTIFRPFNWIGPRLDSLESARQGSSRVITQLILNLVCGDPILLVEGGGQKRCFTDVDDGIECLFRIIRNEGGRCDGAIVNIGNPDGECSVRELAERLVARFEAHPLRGHFPPFAGMRTVGGSAYYGKGYEDCLRRKPSIRKAEKCCGWRPVVPLDVSIDKTLDYFLREALKGADDVSGKPA